MFIKHEGNTPTVECGNCGDVEVISLTINGSDLYCVCGAHVGRVDSLCGSGVEECHLVRVA